MSTHPGTGLLSFPLTPRQAALVAAPIGEPQSLFLEGPAGCGKTTAGVARLLRLLAEGVAADSILVLVPQRTLARPYYDALRSPLAPPGMSVDILTIGGLAQRSVELYWPLVAAAAGFAQPERPPVFLTLETAQYYMDRLIAPYIAAGAFGEVTLARQRLISQVLDNLNKAAIAGFPHQEIGDRLGAAWAGESARLAVYRQVQACADDFRRFCLAHNLLDFSLQVEVFEALAQRLLETLDRLHAEYPLMSWHDRSKVEAQLAYVGDENLVHAVTETLLTRGQLVGDQRRIARADFKPKLSAAQRKLKERLVQAYRAARFQPPELSAFAAEAGGQASALRDLVELCVAEGELVHLEGELYLHAEHEQALKQLLREKLQSGRGLTVSEIRDLLQTTRKFAVPICEYLDRLGFTRRDGDLRFLAETVPHPSSALH